LKSRMIKELVVHHSKIGLRMSLWVIHVIPAIPACPVRPQEQTFRQRARYEYA